MGRRANGVLKPLDSRFRGNDGVEIGNDGAEIGSGGAEIGNDGVEIGSGGVEIGSGGAIIVLLAFPTPLRLCPFATLR